MSLTNKQRIFLAEYLQCWNATESAKRAGYSEKTAYSQGQRLLKNVEIMMAIDERIMGADEAASRLSDIARGDLADLAEITPNSFTFRLMVRNEAGELVVNPHTKLIKKIKQKVTTILAKNEEGEDREIVETELELYSAHEAQKDILKYRGKLTNVVEITGKGGNPIEVKPIDYRFAIASLAPGPMDDSPTPSEGEDSFDGEEMG